MEFFQLKYFQTIARLEHISKAAEELNISQPALSMTISQIEAELGVRLFDRKGRRIELNAYGRVFLDGINKMFIEFENAKSKITDMSNIMSSHISLATTSPRLLAGILKDFLADHANIMIHQFFDVGDMIEKLLLSGSIDFCITSPPIAGKDFQSVILRDDDIVLIVPTNHRFAGRKSIRLEEVSDDPFITLVQNYNYRMVTDQLCRAAGFTPNIVFEVDDSLMLDMLNLGRGISLVPRYLVSTYKKYAIELVDIEIEAPLCSLQIGLSWVKNKFLSKTAEDFKNYIIMNYDRYF